MPGRPCDAERRVPGFSATPGALMRGAEHDSDGEQSVHSGQPTRCAMLCVAGADCRQGAITCTAIPNESQARSGIAAT